MVHLCPPLLLLARQKVLPRLLPMEVLADSHTSGSRLEEQRPSELARLFPDWTSATTSFALRTTAAALRTPISIFPLLAAAVMVFAKQTRHAEAPDFARGIAELAALRERKLSVLIALYAHLGLGIMLLKPNRAILVPPTLTMLVVLTLALPAP